MIGLDLRRRETLDFARVLDQGYRIAAQPRRGNPDVQSFGGLDARYNVRSVMALPMVVKMGQTPTMRYSLASYNNRMRQFTTNLGVSSLDE